MADTATQTLNAEQSYNVLVSQVHAPVFFNKLASVYGIKPQTPEEAQELLVMAGKLRNAHEIETTKQASTSTNYLTQAQRDLDIALGQAGVPSVSEELATKRAAAEAAKNPLIQEAAVVFSNYMAQAAQGK
jgi:hypothetical protein